MSYGFHGVADQLAATEGADTSLFGTSFANRTLSVASALNNNGVLIGFWLTREEDFHTYSLQFGVNPKVTSRDSVNFLGLSGSDVSCFQLLVVRICNPEYPYGVRVVPSNPPGGTPTAVSAFLNTPQTAVTVAGSLPFMRYPGNFVDENRQGILATTQLAPDTQYGVLVRGESSVVLEDIPWLIAINDLDLPLVIAYDAENGACLVYGLGCRPTPTPCDYDPNPGNGGHNSGREDSGHAWGHNKCKDGVVDGNNGGGNDRDEDTSDEGTSGGDGGSAGGDSVIVQTGALLLRLNADNSVDRFRFPGSVQIGLEFYPVKKLFPLAINNTRVVLRGDFYIGNTLYDKRLFSCAIQEDLLDANSDGIVDCTEGLSLLGGVDNSIRAGTVLGFALNNDDLLVGNLGYNAAGIGLPIVVNVATVVPQAVILGNLSRDTAGWELNTITDVNDDGMMSGYGYKDCGSTPESFYLDPLATDPLAAVYFRRGTFEHPAYLAPGADLSIAPTMTGGSGSFEFRASVRKPGEAEWQAIGSGWTATPFMWNPGTYLGDVCFRIEARDLNAPGAADQQMVVRYSVGVSAPPDGSADGIGQTDLLKPTNSDAPIGLLLGGIGGTGLLALLVAGLLRRRAPRRRQRGK